MKKIIYAAMAFAPVLAFAQDISKIDSLVGQIGTIIKRIIPIIFALAIIYFFYGLAEYIRSAGDPKKAAEGKSIMIYGVLAIAVMISIYGLVNWLQSAFGITNTSSVTPPTVNGL